MSSGFELPAPPAAALAHSRTVSKLIRAELARASGWISFARYMELALYAPGLGYYSAGARKLGPDGDFTTAPERTPLFGRCLARACARFLAGLGGGGSLLEVGAGTGSLMLALLPALEALGCPPERYLVLETSADLRERQAQASEHLPARLRARVAWLDAFPDPGIRGVVVANEVLDALPVERFLRRAAGIEELGVTWAETAFAWAPRPAGAALEQAVLGLESALGAQLAPGYCSEICLRLPGFVSALSGGLREGAALLIDYGLPRHELYHTQRDQGSLVCHYRHRAHGDPFRHPGLQDISAWVDFTAVAEAAEGAGLHVAGFTTQAHFIIAAGLGDELEADPARASEARSLLLPGEMGEKFKVMTLTRGVPGPDVASAARDLRHLL